MLNYISDYYLMIMRRSFKYPWTELESYIVENKADKLYLLGYGSLMNANSSKITIKEKQDRIPVIASGIIRVFDYPMPHNAYSRYGKPKHPLNNAALNVYSTDSEEDKINGILQTINISDISSLREREISYDLILVNAVDWETGKKFNLPVFALTYSGDNQEIYPHRRYLEVCANGAKGVSDEFEKYFYRTTYLFDKKTTIDNWIKEDYD